ncbi:MAG: RagB/SusD family nutrient uptake outer membrane protein, partial [Tannerella sp.]|nr:RagB/SusD family nutrient uptake outer membrane protein [Tannerella sp.]
MKSKIYSIIFALAALTFSGCTDVMNKTNLGQLLAEDIWEDPYLIRGYMDNIINGALPDGKRVTMGATEELYRRYGEMEFVLNSYNINSEVGTWPYGTISNINKFLENVDRCPSEKLSDELKTQYKAQMLTMRGWRYFNMVRMYGGVPLILHEQRLDEDLYVTRAKTSECIAQIVKDFDDAIAIESFPMRWENE